MEKRFKHSEESKKRLFREGKIVSPFKGKKNPELSKRQTENNVSKRPEVRKKISLAKKEYFSKGNHPWNYIDGSSRNRKYGKKEWINLAKQIYGRDDYTCQRCGKKGGLLNAHHIIPWAGNPELRFEKDNLLTLCVPCHAKEHYQDTIGPVNALRVQEVSQWKRKL